MNTVSNRLHLLLALLLPISVINAQNLEDLSFGSDSTLDVITWNIEWFPKNGQSTLNYVKGIVEALDADVIALQEIDNKNSFVTLRESLPGYDGIYVNSDYLELAYLYKTGVVEVVDSYEIFEGYQREFPRSPFVLEMVFNNTAYVIINNHLKCCGDGFMEPGNPYDEETRRHDAVYLLEKYMDEGFFGENIILLGDLNDLLTDEQPHNVFSPLLDDPSNYRFTDTEIASGPSANWSYPGWPSHLDHIMITDELYEDFDSPGSEVLTIRIDDHLEGGWNEYENYVSDHRPVGLKLITTDTYSISEHGVHRHKLYAHFSAGKVHFGFDPVPDTGLIRILTITGNEAGMVNMANGSTGASFDFSRLPAGVYLAGLYFDGSMKAVCKFIVAD